MGAHASLDGDSLVLDAFAGPPDGSAWVRDSIEGPAAEPITLGREAGERLLVAGGRELLGEAEGSG